MLIDFNALPPWPSDGNGRVMDRPLHKAEFWKKSTQRRIECTLCYRRCKLKNGETGWCDYRRNVNGKIELLDHGVLARAQRQILAYGGGVSTFDPGALAMGIGGIKCTAGCLFCYNGNLVWDPEKLPWVQGERQPGLASGWYLRRAMLHPAGALKLAQDARCTHLVYADNEPLLSWEYTHDCCRLGKANGLKNVIYTNGFSETPAIDALAPYVDCVDVGVKGSLSEPFYAKWMKAPGAIERVKQSILAWKKHKHIRVVISDLIATPTMQPDDEFEQAATALYKWLAETFGQIDLMLGVMHRRAGMPNQMQPLIPPGDGPLEHYAGRYHQALAIARACGNHYAHHMTGEGFALTCHNCGALLLKTLPGPCQYAPCQRHFYFCTCWSHEQNVTDQHCDQCGARVPITTLSPAELATAHQNAAELAELGAAAFAT
jgi:pyruvate formate lyase activating enzyme